MRTTRAAALLCHGQVDIAEQEAVSLLEMMDLDRDGAVSVDDFMVKPRQLAFVVVLVCLCGITLLRAVSIRLECLGQLQPLARARSVLDAIVKPDFSCYGLRLPALRFMFTCCAIRGSVCAAVEPVGTRLTSDNVVVL